MIDAICGQDSNIFGLHEEEELPLILDLAACLIGCLDWGI